MKAARASNPERPFIQERASTCIPASDLGLSVTFIKGAGMEPFSARGERHIRITMMPFANLDLENIAW